MTTETKEITKPTPGAPANNKNGYRHGLYSAKTPDNSVTGMTYVRAETNKFRRSLEELMMDPEGNIAPGDALLIIAITDWVILGMWAALESSNHYSKLTPDQRLAYRREIPRSKNEAVKLMRQLVVQGQGDTPWLPELPTILGPQVAEDRPGCVANNEDNTSTTETPTEGCTEELHVTEEEPRL